MKFSQFIDDSELSFHSPITREEWDKITDVELERTEEITFRTPSGNEVLFRKVKHGKWIEEPSSFPNHPFVRCSECGEEALLDEYGVAKSKFCPNCGARMGETE